MPRDAGAAGGKRAPEAALLDAECRPRHGTKRPKRMAAAQQGALSAERDVSIGSRVDAGGDEGQEATSSLRATERVDASGGDSFSFSRLTLSESRAAGHDTAVHWLHRASLRAPPSLPSGCAFDLEVDVGMADEAGCAALLELASKCLPVDAASDDSSDSETCDFDAQSAGGFGAAGPAAGAAGAAASADAAVSSKAAPATYADVCELYALPGSPPASEWLAPEPASTRCR